MNSKAVSIVIVAVLSSCQMQYTCSSNALSFSIIIADLDQVENDSLIEEVKTTLDIINSNNDILPEYMLDYTAGEQLDDLTIIGVINANCFSNNTYMYRNTTISCCSNSVPQSNTTVYIAPSGTSVVPGLVAVMKAYQWTMAAIITENNMPFLTVSKRIDKMFSPKGIDVNAEHLLNPTSSNEDYQSLFNDEPHIFIVNTGYQLGLQLLCQAYHKGKHYPNYAWILINWSDQWWMEYEDEVNCTLSDINTVLIRSLILTPYPSNEVTAGSTPYSITHYVVDAVTVLAVATDDCLKHNDTGLVYCRDNLYKYIEDNEFVTLDNTGSVYFEGRYRSADVTLVQQYINEQGNGLNVRTVGYINASTLRFEMFENISRTWPDGIPPDGTTIMIINVLEGYIVSIKITLMMILLCFVICCFVFNIVYRKRKIVKLISPNLNYLMLIGTVLLLISGSDFRTRDRVSQTIICMILRIAASIGYDIMIAVTIVKLWRVFIIFSCFTGRKLKIQDWKLVVAVIVIALMDFIINFPLLVLAQLNNDTNYLSSSDTNDQDVQVEYYIYSCGSTTYSTIYTYMSILYKFILHVIGLVLAFLTRKVRIDVLNDYKITVATMSISTALVLLMFLLLAPRVQVLFNDKQVAARALVWSLGIFFFGCTYLSITFIPKFIALYKDPQGSRIFAKLESNPAATSMSIAAEVPAENKTHTLSSVV